MSSWWTTEIRQEMPDRGQAKMRAETKPKKTRVDRNEVVGFRWICIYLVFRGDPVWYRMIYRDISWYHIPYHAISQDTIYRDTRIVSISRNFGTDIEISYPVQIFLDTEDHFLPTTRCTKFGAPRYSVCTYTYYLVRRKTFFFFFVQHINSPEPSTSTTSMWQLF